MPRISPWSTEGNRRFTERCRRPVHHLRLTSSGAPTVDRALLMALASRAHENAREEFAVFLDAVENDKRITI